MPYQLRVFDPKGSLVRELTMNASSHDDALAEFRKNGDNAGLLLLSIEPISPSFRNGFLRERVARLDVAWWCKEVRTLLGAGMTVVEALETLNAQELGAARSRVHAALTKSLREGQALSDALESTGEFPALLIASVRASERTSSLVEALDDYLRYHQMIEVLRKKVVSTAIYPAVVVSLGILITLFLMIYVLPRFSRMYGDLRGPVSGATEVMLYVSKILVNHSMSVLLISVALVGILVVAWRSGWLTRTFSAVLQNFDPLQRQIDQFRLAKLYQSLALMFKGGMALDDALARCKALDLGDRMTAEIEQAQLALNRGESVSKAFGNAGLTDLVSLRLLAVGERTGNFDRVLVTIAERHADNFSVFIERATRLVEPLLLLSVALVVGGIVVMMYMPIFDIASSVR